MPLARATLGYWELQDTTLWVHGYLRVILQARGLLRKELKVYVYGNDVAAVHDQSTV